MPSNSLNTAQFLATKLTPKSNYKTDFYSDLQRGSHNASSGYTRMTKLKVASCENVLDWNDLMF